MALEDIKTKVTSVLIQMPETRDSDDLLYYYVAKKIIGGWKASTITFEDFLFNRAKMGLPTMESVCRMRRKAQEEHPELKASRDTIVKRGVAEEDFLEYVRNGKL